MKHIIITLLSFILLTSSTAYGAAQSENNIPLPAEQAFSLTTKNDKPHQIIAHWKIAPGYYLYRDRIKFNLNPESAGTLNKIKYPPSIQKEDEILGKYQAYDHDLIIKITLPSTIPVGTTLAISYQGCASSGFCYPPIKREISLAASNSKSNSLAQTGANNTSTLPPQSSSSLQSPSTSSPENLSEQDRTTRLLASHNYLWILLSFFGFGILLTFTPCVLPMIPILSGIIAGHSKGLNTRKAFKLSLAYVLTMAVTYAGAGVLAGYAGSHLQALLQNPWVLSAFSAIFVLLALSMFGYFELQLPHRIQNHFSTLHQRQQGGNYFGVISMGFLSTLIVSPCVTAPLVGALSYIGQTGNAFLGGIALFTLGLGMGVPLLVIGTTEGTFLPKSGKWMHGIKVLFGILLLGVAIWLISRIVPGLIVMLLWSALFVGTGIYLRQYTPTSVNVSKVIVNISFFTLLYGALIAIGGLLGNTDPLHPIHFSSSKSPMNNEQPLTFITIKNISDLDRELANAKQLHKFVMLDFYADWCVACQEMEKNTFENPNVKGVLKNIILLKADITSYDDADQELAQRLKVIAPPTLLFYNPEGNELSSVRIVGKMEPEKFIQRLKVVLANPK
jgi:thiol:disulfide interchange protein DsbD